MESGIAKKFILKYLYPNRIEFGLQDFSNVLNFGKLCIPYISPNIRLSQNYFVILSAIKTKTK